MMLLGYTLQCIGWIIFTFKPFSVMLCGLIFHVLGYGLTASSPSVVVSVYIITCLFYYFINQNIATSEIQGRVLGSITTSMSLAQILTPLVFSLLYSIEHIIPFIASGCLSLLNIVLVNSIMYFTRKNERLNEIENKCYNVNKS